MCVCVCVFPCWAGQMQKKVIFFLKDSISLYVCVCVCMRTKTKQTKHFLMNKKQIKMSLFFLKKKKTKKI